MLNPADTEYKVHRLIERRWSPRAFSERKVTPDVLRRLFEAARWAPSSYNEQPWRFMVALKENEEAFKRMLSCLAQANRKWAEQAPVLMLSVTKLHFDKNHKPNPHAFHDVGLAMGNLILEATDLGLYVHQMAGFDSEKAIALFDIPAGYQPVAAMALGYVDEEEADTDKERKRRPFDEFVFKGKFGEPSGLFA